jgi:hypothetical protein
MTGVEVSSPGDLTQREARLAAKGLTTEPELGATCCYRLHSASWAHDLNGHQALAGFVHAAYGRDTGREIEP